MVVNVPVRLWASMTRMRSGVAGFGVKVAALSTSRSPASVTGPSTLIWSCPVPGVVPLMSVDSSPSAVCV